MLLQVMNKRFSSMSQPSASLFILRLLRQFEDVGIRYCVLRSYEQLPDEHGNDLDILVAEKDLPMARSGVMDVSRDLGWHKVAEVRRFGYNGLYFCSPDRAERWLLVDLFTETHWRGLSYTSKEKILEERVRFKDFHVAGPGAEAALLVVKELLPWGKVKSKNMARDRIQYCAVKDEHGFLECLRPAFGKRTGTLLLRASKVGDWDSIESRVNRLRRALLIRSLTRHPLRQPLAWIEFLYGHIVHRIRKPLGFFIVVLGPDGCGKTTIAKHVGQAWQQTVPPGKEPEYIHGDFNNLPRLRGIRRLWAKMRGRPLPPEPDYTKKHAGAEVVPHSLLKSLLYLGYYFWGYVLGHAKVQRIKAQDRILIADRYFYDYFFQRGNMRLPHWLLRFLTWFIPKPDLTVVLNADTEAIYARKQELTVEEIDRQQAVIRRICRWLPNVIEVRTDQDIESTVAEVKVAMTDRLLSK